MVFHSPVLFCYCVHMEKLVHWIVFRYKMKKGLVKIRKQKLVDTIKIQ